MAEQTEIVGRDVSVVELVTGRLTGGHAAPARQLVAELGLALDGIPSGRQTGLLIAGEEAHRIPGEHRVSWSSQRNRHRRTQ